MAFDPFDCGGGGEHNYAGFVAISRTFVTQDPYISLAQYHLTDGEGRPSVYHWNQLVCAVAFPQAHSIRSAISTYRS